MNVYAFMHKNMDIRVLKSAIGCPNDTRIHPSGYRHEMVDLMEGGGGGRLD